MFDSARASCVSVVRALSWERLSPPLKGDAPCPDLGSKSSPLPSSQRRQSSCRQPKPRLTGTSARRHSVHAVDRRRRPGQRRCRSTRARSSPATGGRTSTASGSSPAAESGEAPPVGQALGERVARPVPDRVRAVRHPAPRGPDVVPPDLHRARRLEGRPGSGCCCTSAPSTTTRRSGSTARQVATHRGGYDGFDVDVTDALHGQRPAGADRLGRGPHRRRPASRSASSAEVGDRGIFYQGSSGIWRTVWMEPVRGRHIDRARA